MHSGKIHINGREIRALRQGMAGELGYELQAPGLTPKRSTTLF